MNDDPYVYPGTSVLKNRLGIRDALTLEAVEREFVLARSKDVPNPGAFDLAHLQAIHRHLFQDVYAWAGDVRTLEISKGGHQFQFRQYIGTGMADVHRRLKEREFLRDLSARDFAKGAGEIIGDVNYVHPFREGNGRTQLFYLKQLAEQAGHRIDLSRIDPEKWMQASREAYDGRYETMARSIERAIVTPEKERSRSDKDRGEQER